MRLAEKDYGKDMKMNLTKTIQIPMVGFGTYLINDDDATSCVSHAIRSGYRHVDTAEILVVLKQILYVHPLKASPLNS